MTRAASSSASPSAPVVPWWRFPIVWMVIAGPAIVVVAALATARIAWTHADPVLLDPVPNARQDAPNHPESPALAARNHAATPSRRPADE